MPEQKITVIIDEQAAISAKTHGFTGDACLKELDKLLNIKEILINVEKTDEYDQELTQEELNQIRLGDFQ